jgi:general secretion pathway protein G
MPRGVNIFEPSLRTGVGSQLERRRVSKSVIKSTRRSRGFTLLELMIVLSVMMILMSIAVPFYQQHVVQAREAVLRQNLDTLNKVIEAYRLDKRESPQTLDDLVTAGYLHQLPNDPMTGHPDWATEQEDSTNALDPQQSGIFRVHSASTGTALNGEAYSTW